MSFKKLRKTDIARIDSRAISQSVSDAGTSQRATLPHWSPVGESGEVLVRQGELEDGRSILIFEEK